MKSLPNLVQVLSTLFAVLLLGQTSTPSFAKPLPLPDIYDDLEPYDFEIEFGNYANGTDPAVGTVTCLAVNPDLNCDGRLTVDDLLLYAQWCQAYAIDKSLNKYDNPSDSVAVAAQKVAAVTTAFAWLCRRPEDFATLLAQDPELFEGLPCVGLRTVNEDFKEEMYCVRANNFSTSLFQATRGLPFTQIYTEPVVVPDPISLEPDPADPTTPALPAGPGNPCDWQEEERMPLPNGDGPLYCVGEIDSSLESPCQFNEPGMGHPPFGPGNPDIFTCVGETLCEPLPPDDPDADDIDVPPMDTCAGDVCVPTCEELGCQEGPIAPTIPKDTCAGICDIQAPPSEGQFTLNFPKEPFGVYKEPIPRPGPKEKPELLLAGTESVATQSISDGGGEGLPPMTCDPVDLVDGYKQEIESDMTLALTGRDFSLVRQYSTNQWNLDSMGLFGKGWSSPSFRYLHLEDSDPDELILIGSRPNAAIRFDLVSTTWYPRGPGQERIELVTDTVDYYRLIVPGGGESQYFAEGPFTGHLKLERDEYGNTWTYAYRQFINLESNIRLWRIYLNGTNDDDAEAVVEFGYYLNNFDQNHALQGLVARVIAYRFVGEGEFREPIETHRLDYTYKNNNDLLSTDVGSEGDLAQVVKYSRVDQAASDGTERVFGPGFPHNVSVTQYRYHTISRAAPVHADAEDRLYGKAHTLKSVFRAAQIEYYAEKLYNDADPAALIAGQSYTVRDAAYRLMLLRDDSVAFDDGGTLVQVNEMASKLVSYENFEESATSTKVARQYLQSSCGCSGASQSLRQDYSRELWTDGSSRDGRSTRIREYVYEMSSPNEWTLYRTRWVDSLQYAGSTAFRKIYDVLDEIDPTDDGVVLRRWITRTVHDGSYRVIEVYSPAANRNRTYTPAASSTAPSIGGSDAEGFAQYFKYTADHRVKEVGVREYNGMTWDEVKQIEIAYPTSPGGDERYHLPTSVTRLAKTTNDPDDEEVVTFEYEFYSGGSFGDSAVRAVKRTVELEQTAENGVDSATATTVGAFDERGRLAWRQAADDVLTHIEYDDASGRVTTVTADAEYAGVPSELEDVLEEPLHTPVPLTVSSARDLLGRVRSTSVPGPGGNPVTEQWTSEYRIIDRSVDADPRQGLRYMTYSNFPPRVDATTYAGPAMVVSSTVQGTALAARSFMLDGTETAGDYEFDPVDPDALIGLIDDEREVGRRRMTVRLTGLIDSVEVWHDVRGDLQRSSEDRSFRQSFTYDPLGRLSGAVTALGDHLKLEYDVLGRVTSKWRGSTSGNMVKIGELFYDTQNDDPSGVGNGNVSRAEVYTGETTDGTRSTIMLYDERDRLVSIKNPLPPHSVRAYDNLDRLAAAATFKGSAPPATVTEDTDRGRYVEISRSQRGLVYRTRLAINPGDLEEGFLEWHHWFDDVGRVVASWGPDSPTSKVIYDSHGRVITAYATDRHDDVRPGNSGSLADAMSVADDHVYEETHYTYDADWGAPTFIEHIVRSHSAALDDGPLTTVSTPNGVATFAGMMYDSVGRMIRRVDFGTNKAPDTDPLDDSFSNGTDPRDSDPVLWPPSNPWTPYDYGAQLVTEVTYDDRGRVKDSIDPMGRMARTLYDDLNQVIATVENAQTIDQDDIVWDDGELRWRVLVPTNTDQDRVTSYAFFNVPVENTPHWYLRQAAHLPFTGTGDDPDPAQVTEYRFGVATGAGSLIDSHALIGSVHFPDEATGEPGAGAEYTVTHTYNTLGEQRTITDQNGTAHAYGLDLLGRVLSDSVTFAGSGPGADIDQTVVAINAEYDDFGRLEHVRSLDDGEAVLNHVKFTHTPLWQIDEVIQDVNSEIGGSGTAERTVEYEYLVQKFSSDTMEFQGNWTRLQYMNYPEVPFASSGSTRLEFEYFSGGATGHEVDEPIGRLSRLSLDHDSTVDTVAEYGYVGLGMVSLVDLAMADVQLDRTIDRTGARRYGTTTSQAVATYPGWDRFGRVKRQMWVGGGYDINTTPDPDVPNRREHVALAFGYDGNSNPTYRQNAQQGAGFGGRWNDRDWVYGYDGLDRLTLAMRGILSTSTTDLVAPDIEDPSPSPFPAGSQKWALDHLGNWTEFAIDLNGDNDFTDFDEIQTRGHNMANEVKAYASMPDQPEGMVPPATPPALTHLSAPLIPPFAHMHDHNGSRIEAQQVDEYGDGVGHKFVYDAWNRLVRIDRGDVDNRVGDYGEDGDTTIASYRYNGLHWRISKFANASPGSTEGQSRQYTYSAAWQPIVEEINDDSGSLEDLGTDRVQQQVWGIRGINDALYRREDRATFVPAVPDPMDPEGEPLEPERYDPGADGIFEKSFYQLTDPQFSVMALVAEASGEEGAAGAVIEQVEYDPYGRVRRTAMDDFDHDGVHEVPDIFSNLSANFALDPSGDHNWDGAVGVPDTFAFLTLWFAADATPRDHLSSADNDNPIGYCGYYHDSETVGIMGEGNGGLYQVRHRVYDPHAGRWLQRDPAGFVDGANLYQYAKGLATALEDVLGLSCNDEEPVGPPEPSFWDRAKQVVHDAMQALSNNVADSDLPDAAKDVLYFTYGAIETATTHVIASSEDATTKSPTEQIVGPIVAQIEDAAEREANHAARANREFSVVSAVHEWVATWSGANDLAAAYWGYDAAEDRMLTPEERLAAGLRGGGSTVLICYGCAGRLSNTRLSPHPQATGSHTSFLRDESGRVTKYQHWEKNPRNPIGFEPGRRFDRHGEPHYNKKTHRNEPTPHVIDPETPGGSRPPEPWEIPQ